MNKVVYQLLLSIFCMLPVSLFSQDVHFSHIHASPTILNPAMTGLFNGQVRFIANSKGQWNGLTKGYRTFAGSVDMRMFEFNREDVIAGGLNIISDKAGDLDFTTTAVLGSVSVLKTLGDHYFAFGLQSGVISNSVDFSKIVAFDIEPDVQSGAPDRINYLDINTGVAWFYNFDRFSNIYLGVSASHLNRPDVSFYKDEDLSESLIAYRKYIFHGGADIEVNRKNTVMPSFIFMDQGPHREITVGSYWKYKTSMNGSRNSTSALYFGGWLRWYAERNYLGTDAIVAAIRMDFKNTFLSLTYDINISSLTRASNGAGGPEFSVIHIIDSWGNKRPTKIRCPNF